MSIQKTRPPLSAFAIVAFCLTPIAIPEIHTSDIPIDVAGYVIDVDLQPQASTFAAEARITFTTAQVIERVAFDLVGLTVDSVKIGAESAAFDRDGGKLVVDLVSRRPAGAELTVTVYYGGAPRDGLLFRTNGNGNPTVFADNWPDRARQWFPSVDHPSDKATVELRVRAPAAWKVVGVGRLITEETLNDGRKLTVWATDRPLPTYSMVFGAGDLVIGNLGSLGCGAPGQRCVPISSWMYPEDAARGPRLFGAAERIVAFFDSLIGPFPYEKLALVQSTTRYGGMENASAIFLYEGVGRADDAESLLAHEIAHQWFGDAVTEGEWPHLWLSEGFATYFTVIYFESNHGAGRAREMLERSKRGYMASPRAVESPVVGEEPADLRDLLNANNYQKGALVLHMLREMVGDEAFFAGIRRYFRDFRHSTALTEDFQRIMEEESGEELDWFFDQWLFRPGYPQIEARYRWDSGRGGMEFVVTQIQPGPPYRFPLTFDVYLVGQDYKAQQTAWIEDRERRSLVILPALPSGVVLDPAGALLAALAVVE